MNNIIGKNIRMERMKKGYSQQNLADALNKSQNWVSGVECGNEIGDEYLMKIAEFLEVPVEEFQKDNNQTVFYECKNSGNFNTYHIKNDIEDIKELLSQIVREIKNL